MLNGNNLCIFEGRISTDIKESSFQGTNGSVTSVRFSIAAERVLTQDQKAKNKQNPGSVKTADFINCSAIGPVAELIKNYFYKGKGIRILARFEEYQTKDKQTGETKYGHVFHVETVNFCIQDPKNGGGNTNTANNNSGTSSSVAKSDFNMFDDDTDSEGVPF